MYQGIGPDGVYRLHQGVHNSDNPRTEGVSRYILTSQLAEGGRKLDQTVLNFFTTRRRRAEGQILIDAAYASCKNLMDEFA